jgi:metal-responsive CopG/Arc/MetJ family transcriptional regulator
MAKERITVTIESGLLCSLDKMIEKKIFASRSHGFEFLVKKEMGAKNA